MEVFSPAPVVTGVLSASGLIVIAGNIRFLLGFGDVKGHDFVGLFGGMYFAWGEKFNYYDAGMGALSLVILIFLQVSSLVESRFTSS